MLGLVDELEIGQRGSAVLHHEGVVALPGGPVRSLVLGAEPVPAAPVIERVPAERGWQGRVLHLQRVAAHDAHPGSSVGQEGRERVDVVLDDHVGVDPVQDVPQLRLAVRGAVDERRPDGLDERAELLDRRLAELRRRLGDEVGPELPGVLRAGVLRWRSEVDEVLLEAQRLQTALPRRLGGEHDPMAAPLEDLADPDAVVRRPVGTLGHEQERHPVVGHRLSPSASFGSLAIEGVCISPATERRVRLGRRPRRGERVLGRVGPSWVTTIAHGHDPHPPGRSGADPPRRPS